MRTSKIGRGWGAFVLSAAFALLALPAQAQRSSIDRLVFFGASLTDSGNAFVWLSQPANQGCGAPLNVPPYDALDDLMVPDGVYAVGGHHFSNGATWAEDLARSLALAGNARPAFASSGIASNYAVGGARAVAGYPCRVNLPAQVAAYVQTFPQTSANSWVGMEIGGNDVRDALVAAAGGQDPTPYLQNALASVGDSIGALYARGARKFLLLNVADLSKAPSVRGLASQLPPPQALQLLGAATALSNGYNQGQLLLRQQLTQLLPGIDIRIVDVYGLLNDIVAQPQNYGLANVTDACVKPNQAPFKCDNPDTYLFWDGVHPTKVVHELIAQRALAVIAP